MDKKKPAAILYLDRNRFDFAAEGFASPISFQLSEQVVSSLEVVNMEMLENQIKAFIEQSHIQPSDITIILAASVVFEKDIADSVLIAQKEEDAQKFWDTIPFEDINSKAIRINGGERIIVVNNNLCEAIKTSFEKFGFSIEMIVPYEALGPDLWNIPGLDPHNSQEILKKLDSFKDYAFELSGGEKTVTNPQIKSDAVTPKKAPPKTRIYVMAGVFISLIVVLVILLIRR